MDLIALMKMFIYADITEVEIYVIIYARMLLWKFRNISCLFLSAVICINTVIFEPTRRRYNANFLLTIHFSLSRIFLNSELVYSK